MLALEGLSHDRFNVSCNTDEQPFSAKSFKNHTHVKKVGYTSEFLFGIY